ncbi:MAG TPA: hypothetical protein VK363_09860 [Pyrinomonadaceae bacterium]|nr:hypothetical protein [Pyrinomonadaceae bacterium]
MQQRQITLEDGRYLVFYTFDEETAASSNSDAGATGAEDSSAQRADEPEAEPQATEERRV